MSDTQDWTGITAGSTQLVAQGSTTAALHTGQWQLGIAVNNIPQTTRSLLIAMLCTAAAAPNIALGTINVVGSTSQLDWYNGGNAYSQGGGNSYVAGSVMSPVYCPLYGQIDTTARVTINASDSCTFTYWVLALPDADLLGTMPIPVAVTNTNFTGNPPTGAMPLLVESNSTATTPLYVADTSSQSGEAGLTLTAAAQTVIAAPAAGKRRVVEWVSMSATGGDAIEFGVNDAATNVWVIFNTAQSVFTPGWILGAGGPGLTVKNGTAARGTVWATWHDEAA